MTNDAQDQGSGRERVVIPRSGEQWAMACAVWVEKHHGDEGPLYIADMIGHFAREGDEGGVETWKEIAAAYERLILRGDSQLH